MLEVKQINLFELLDEVKKGLIVIPDFQRDFIWELNQIEELLNSVIKGYFIGSILMLESSLDPFRFAPRLIRGVCNEKNILPEEFIKKQARKEGRNTIKYVLDGQQRITSLYYAFFEPSIPPSEDYDEPRRFYIRPDTLDIYGLADPLQVAKKLHLSPEQKERWLKFYKSEYGIDFENLPTMGIFRSKSDFENYVKEKCFKNEFRDKLKDLFEKIQKYTIPVITLPSHTSNEDIVNTFERINRTGTELNIFELAVARYYPLGINLNELKKDITFFTPLKDPEVSALKIIALLKGKEPKSKNLLDLVDREEKTPKVVSDFENLWKKAIIYLSKALQRIERNYGGTTIKLGRKIQLIPYNTLIIPLAYMLYEIEEKMGRAAKLYKIVDFWYWASVFSQRYSHGVDTKSFEDVKEIKSCFEEERNPQNIIINYDYIKEELLNASRTSAIAKGFFNLLILNNPKDLLDGQNVIFDYCEIDHIFPKSRLGEDADNVFNFTILTKKTNQQKGDKLPSDFIDMCLQSHGYNYESLKNTFASHFISETALEALKNNDLNKFIQIRADEFIKKLKNILEGR